MTERGDEEIALAAAAFLDATGWAASVHTEPPQVRGQATVSGTEYEVFARIDENAGVLAFYTVHPNLADRAERTHVMLLLTWINRGLMLGNFELDPVGGAILFKTSVSLPNWDPACASFEAIITGNVATMDHYASVIGEVGAGTLGVAEALRRTEG